MKEYNLKEIAEGLVALREKAGLSVEQVRESIGVDLHPYEAGTLLPTTADLIKLSELYRVSIDSILGNNINTTREQAAMSVLQKIYAENKSFGFHIVGTKCELQVYDERSIGLTKVKDYIVKTSVEKSTRLMDLILQLPKIAVEESKKFEYDFKNKMRCLL
jgi:transcriptional regulator with XRE-family HTH domain